MKTNYEQIVNTSNIASLNSTQNIPEIITLGKQENLAPASQDKRKVLLLVIDVQNDFMEGIGSLPVQGSKGDVERLTRWIYANMENITQIICSLDTHSISQIFHPEWWVDKDGNQPQPFTLITYADVLSGKWSAANGKNDVSLDYLKNLEATGKKQLCIWPYHCLCGTRGAELESEFAKMLYFHSSARKSTPVLSAKGQNPNTEMYGIIKAEYDPDNYINMQVLNAVEQSDEIYIAGEASSHCVLASTLQILEHFADKKDITKRITVLSDCMSPIGGFEDATKKSFEEMRDKFGIQIKKSVDIR
jgi:hypothetical protein